MTETVGRSQAELSNRCDSDTDTAMRKNWGQASASQALFARGRRSLSPVFAPFYTYCLNRRSNRNWGAAEDKMNVRQAAGHPGCGRL